MVRSNADLHNLAQRLYKHYFHHNLNCRTVYDKRFSSTAGQFLPDDKSHPQCMIKINPDNVKDFDKTVAVKILKHELIHLYLYRTNHKGSNPYGHNDKFYTLAKKIGATGRFTPWSKKYRWCRECDNATLHIYLMGNKIFIQKNRVHKRFVDYGYKSKVYYIGDCKSIDQDKVRKIAKQAFINNCIKPSNVIARQIKIALRKNDPNVSLNMKEQ